MKCRCCKAETFEDVLDLGAAPLSNSFLSSKQLGGAEQYYPLKVVVCKSCFFIQLNYEADSNEIFNENYVYFSGVSNTWIDHTKKFSKQVIKEFEITENNFVVEVASNDGTLLKNFRDQSIPCLGIEPTISTATKAKLDGLEVLVDFFSTDVAAKVSDKKGQADLIICNNVLAHVPDLFDFVNGLRLLLSPGGVITIEVPNVYNIIEGRQFDTVYHEHFSYFSFHSLKNILERFELRIFKVESLTTHGGSMRAYVAHKDSEHLVHSSCPLMADREIGWGVHDINVYKSLQTSSEVVKNDILAFLIEQKRQGKTVVGYGAAAKGNTLLNFAGIRGDLLSCVVDAAPSKQGMFLPGSRIPVKNPSVLNALKPDYILILPWNIAEEVRTFVKKDLGIKCQFATAVPELQIT